MGSVHYCLRWNNHQSNLLGVFSQLLRDESLVDVTLACSEGHSIRAHKVVLSACSSYFQTLFVDHPSRHPIVILKDVRFAELRTLIEFMYKGEVNVEYCQLSALLKTAESLKIKGLAEMTNLGPSRDYKQDSQNEQTEPTELVNKESTNEEQERAETPPRICRTPERPASREPLRSTPPTPEDCGRNDMTLHSTNNLVTCSSVPGSTICSRISSPLNCEPVPGPSGLPPVQQVPLSLKKEVDWGGGCADDKNTRESPSDYARHPHDPSLKKEVDWGGGATEDKKSSIENYSEYSRHPHDSDLDRGDDDSPRLYPCMYCGASFPHQSKLTRHILSHSLETLKYREQLQHPTSLNLPEPLHLMESHFSGRVPISHLEAAEATDHPSTPMDLELSGDGAGVVLCKFCGKSFPDVSSLIAHLPVHTGDRPFKCEFCGKAFKLRHHMKDHCRVHTGERPFRCALCGKTFSRSTILKAHEKTHFPKYVRNFLSPSPLDAKEESPH
uniref:BTB domain-containing protein n=2 Tax=Photinus pyralis TaxID=7054 RepID=A0A1Y1K002_PHOPY